MDRHSYTARATYRTIALMLLAALTGIATAPVLAANDTANLVARIAKLERALENRGLLDLLQQVETLQAEVQTLRGKIDEQAFTIDRLRKTQRETYVDIDQRVANLESGTVSGAAPAGVPSAPPLATLDSTAPDVVAGTPAPQSTLQVETHSTSPATPQAVAPAPGSPTAAAPAQPGSVAAAPLALAPNAATVDNEASESAYREAFSLLKAGQYDESIEAFGTFLTTYPNSQYADNAQYWLGETHYVKREFEPAVAEYRKLIDGYPQSKKRSHAMLKIGYSFHELGRVDEARAVLEDLRSRYAGSAAARLAEERIQRILTEQSQ